MRAYSQLLESVTSPAHTVTNLYEANRNVLDTKTNKTLGGTTLSQYDYRVNAIGQREQVDRTGNAFAPPPSSAPDTTNAQHASILNWKYDALGQVVRADYNDNTLDQSYAYDQIGNRLSKTQASVSASYTSNALNQLTSKTENASTAAYTYDADGNLLSDGIATYTWDGEHRLLTSTKGGVTTTYQYDYLSRRIAKETSGVVTRYHYDGWNPVAEYTGTSLSKTYLWGTDLSGSLQGAGGVGGLLSVTELTSNTQQASVPTNAQHASVLTSYPTYDGNGNVREQCEPSSILDRSAATRPKGKNRKDECFDQYDDFGKEIASKTTGVKANRFAHRFSTKPLDSETGFYYYGYRYYNPVTGKWLSRDPIEEEGGQNLYGFVDNGGVNQWDLLGLEGCELGDYRGGKTKTKAFTCGSDPDSDRNKKVAQKGLEKAFKKAKKIKYGGYVELFTSTGYQFDVEVSHKYECCECRNGDVAPRWYEQSDLSFPVLGGPLAGCWSVKYSNGLMGAIDDAKVKAIAKSKCK